MEESDLQSEVGEGQIVTLYHDGRRRVYRHMTGTVVKTNREWQEMQRRWLNLPGREGGPAELHLADGKVAHGYLRVEDFGPGAPGRKVLRFALVTQKPSVPAA